MPTLEGDWAALAELVRARRRELGIPTQEAAAEPTGISKNTWQRLEMGRPIGPSSLSAIAARLGWPPSYPVAVLQQGKDAPVPAVEASGGSTASVGVRASGPAASVRLRGGPPSLTAKASGTVEEPVVRHISVEDSATVTDSVVVVRPEIGRGKASTPLPDELDGLYEWVVTLSLSIPIDGNDYKELDDKDIKSIINLVTMEGRHMANVIAEAKRRLRVEHSEADPGEQ